MSKNKQDNICNYKYPKNLSSLANNPANRYIYLKIAIFTTLIISIFIAWYSLYMTITEKRSLITNIYTIIFSYSPSDSRPPQQHANLAFDELKKQNFIYDIKLIDNSKLLKSAKFDERVKIPAMLYVRVKANSGDEFQLFLQKMRSALPKFTIKNHSDDSRISRLIKRYNNFLVILSMCSFSALLLLFSVLWLILDKWLIPYKKTIEILNVIGSDEQNIIDIFKTRLKKDIYQGALFGIFISAIILYIILQLVEVNDILNIKNSNSLYIAFLVFAIANALFIYIIVKLRAISIFKTYIKKGY